MTRPGAQTDAYTYDVYGALRSSTGTATSDYRYTGEQTDDNAARGLYYLRARHYDPALGVFLSKDPLPLMQRYAYVGGNPVNYVDPTGLCPWGTCIPGGAPGNPLDSAVEWTDRNVVQPIKNSPGAARDFATSTLSEAGYVDLNITACYYGCFTAGVQWSWDDGLHPYLGSGGGFMLSGGLSWAPGQSISQGWNCSGQSGYGLVGGQIGAGGITSDKEGSPNFAAYGEVGVGPGFGAAATCAYVW